MKEKKIALAGLLLLALFLLPAVARAQGGRHLPKLSSRSASLSSSSPEGWRLDKVG